MSNVPNFEPNRSMDKRPQELKFKPCMIKDRDPVEFSGWRPKQICCGTIFIGPQGQFLLDPKYIRLHTGKCMYLTLYDDICQSVNKTVIPYDERDSDIRFGAPESSKSSHTSFDGGLEKQSSEADNSLLSGSTQIESSGLSSRNLRPRKRTMMI
ncbi:hypothetical protein RF11_07726 [Thelohanellus kitauei]|uniref:Uncharacterized protein n=1 Tax=Thelohanellus kitauei TaxID=669202 RepID=A0A0C2JDN0_THEKT|nr:hypothetical protein RF11_07726 [Thelohanellus kitauei]